MYIAYEAQSVSGGVWGEGLMDFSALGKMLCFNLFLWLLMFLYLYPEGRTSSSCLVQLPQHTVALTEDAFCCTSVRFSSDQQGADHYFFFSFELLSRSCDYVDQTFNVWSEEIQILFPWTPTCLPPYLNIKCTVGRGQKRASSERCSLCGSLLGSAGFPWRCHGEQTLSEER